MLKKDETSSITRKDQIALFKDIMKLFSFVYLNYSPVRLKEEIVRFDSGVPYTLAQILERSGNPSGIIDQGGEFRQLGGLIFPEAAERADREKIMAFQISIAKYSPFGNLPYRPVDTSGSKQYPDMFFLTAEATAERMQLDELRVPPFETRISLFEHGLLVDSGTTFTFLPGDQRISTNWTGCPAYLFNTNHQPEWRDVINMTLGEHTMLEGIMDGIRNHGLWYSPRYRKEIPKGLPTGMGGSQDTLTVLADTGQLSLGLRLPNPLPRLSDLALAQEFGIPVSYGTFRVGPSRLGS